MTANNLETVNHRPAASFFALSAVILLLAGAVTPAFSTTARAVEFDAKVAEADTIVLGECKTTRSELDPSGKWIVTYSTFAVKKSFKGSAAGEVTIVTPGGQVGELHQSTVGIPEFEKGDQKVLFVKQRQIGSSLLYANQGSYDVTRDARGETAIVPTESAVVLIDEQTGRARSATEPYRSLRSFESDVKTALNRSAEQRTLQSAVGGNGQRSLRRNWAYQFAGFVQQNKFILAALLAGLVLSLIPLIKRR